MAVQAERTDSSQGGDEDYENLRSLWNYVLCTKDYDG
jgi:hypothetical protein